MAGAKGALLKENASADRPAEAFGKAWNQARNSATLRGGGAPVVGGRHRGRSAGAASCHDGNDDKGYRGNNPDSDRRALADVMYLAKVWSGFKSGVGNGVGKGGKIRLRR